MGIDVAEERKGLDLVVLDGNRAIVDGAGGLTVAGCVELSLIHDPDIVCVDGPSGWATAGRSRAAERGLRAIGIASFATPTDPGDHPFYRWVRISIGLFDAFRAQLRLYGGGDARGTVAEVFPAASAALLAGRGMARGDSKVRFRRRALADAGVDADRLPNVDRVDAALAALTGICALEGTSFWVGDPAEGVVLLPGSEPDRPLPRADAPTSPSTRPGQHRTRTSTSRKRCECGCGAEVRRRFLPGHDAKLKSQLLRRARSGDVDAAQDLAERGWSAPRPPG